MMVPGVDGPMAPVAATDQEENSNPNPQAPGALRAAIEKRLSHLELHDLGPVPPTTEKAFADAVAALDDRVVGRPTSGWQSWSEVRQGAFGLVYLPSKGVFGYYDEEESDGDCLVHFGAPNAGKGHAHHSGSRRHHTLLLAHLSLFSHLSHLHHHRSTGTSTLPPRCWRPLSPTDTPPSTARRLARVSQHPGLAFPPSATASYQFAATALACAAAARQPPWKPSPRRRPRAARPPHASPCCSCEGPARRSPPSLLCCPSYAAVVLWGRRFAPAARGSRSRVW